MTSKNSSQTPPISTSPHLVKPSPNDTNFVYSEFDFNNETPERIQRLNDLWADGFRIIVPMYWKEFNFSFQRSPLIILGALLVAVFLAVLWAVYSVGYSVYITQQPTWMDTLLLFFHHHMYVILGLFLVVLPIYPAYDYYRMHTNVEAFIARGGVKPPNVQYDKFFICEDDGYIIACVGVKRGETLEDPPAGSTPSTQDTDTPSVMSVWRLTVDPAYRKYGLGRKMMQLCEDYANECKVDCIKLLAGNIDSIRFYERLKYDVDRVAWSRGRHVSLYFRKDLRPKSSANPSTKPTVATEGKIKSD